MYTNKVFKFIKMGTFPLITKRVLTEKKIANFIELFTGDNLNYDFFQYLIA